MNQAVRTLGLFLLIMLITGAIDSVRNLPATALFGPSLVFFFVFSAIVFLIPAGLISAELSSAWTEQGGIYDWVRMAFGEKVALIAIWLQWINTMVWYPTILSFIAGVIAYMVNPELANNKLYLVSVILVVFWGLTLINFRGVHTSARFASVCALVGMILPMMLIIGLALLWLVQGRPLNVHFTLHNVFPHLGETDSWISLTAIMTSFLGMELATVHVRYVTNAQQVFPRALMISVIFILFTMVFGSLAIAIVLPHDQINLVNGIMQAFDAFLSAYHLQALLPMLTVLIFLGTLGGIINWIISPAKGLLRAAQSGYFPRYFAEENSRSVPARMLFLQAVLVSVMCAAFFLMPSVNGSYWLLTALSTQLYMVMYVFMFVAAIRLRYKYPDRRRPFRIPGGKYVGMWVLGLLGVLGSVITLVVGFFPPGGIDVGGQVHYELVFTSGMMLMMLPVLFFYAYKKYTKKTNSAA